MQRGPGLEDGQEMEHLLEEREFEAEDLDFGDSFLEEVVRTAPLMARRLERGERLGGRDGQRFEIVEPLGEGAMGQVFRARDEELQREVALKLLFPRAEEEADLALREARAIAQLDHENIVRIFDVSEWIVAPALPRVPFLVMECLEGESLSALLARERPSLPRILELMRGVAAGLAHAHEHHVIHRDLKPSNIFLTTAGGVKLLDFGLAWLGATNGGGVPHLPTAGTPPYMAPEQWRGEAVDARTDIWAAGVVLFELLTGELPYPSDSLEALRARVLSPEPVPLLRERRPELPWELEALVSVIWPRSPRSGCSPRRSWARSCASWRSTCGPGGGRRARWRPSAGR